MAAIASRRLCAKKQIPAAEFSLPAIIAIAKTVVLGAISQIITASAIQKAARIKQTIAQIAHAAAEDTTKKKT